MKTWRKFLTVLTGTLLLAAGGAMAQTTNYWTNTVGGAWNTAGNWDPNTVPAANNAWVIFTNNAGTAYTVDFAGVNTNRSAQLRITSDNIVFDLKGKAWLATAPAADYTASLGHMIGAAPGSTSTVTFSSSVAGQNWVNFNPTDDSGIRIGTNNGMTVININTNLGYGVLVDLSKNTTTISPAGKTNVFVNVNGPGAAVRIVQENYSYISGVWNISNGGLFESGYVPGSSGTAGQNGPWYLNLNNGNYRTGQMWGGDQTAMFGWYPASVYITMVSNSLWTADSIWMLRQGTMSVLVDNSTINGINLTIGSASDPWGTGTLTVQNGGTVGLSGYLLVSKPNVASKTNLFVLNNSTLRLGGGTTNGALTNASVMRASGNIIGIGQNRGLVRNEKYLEIGSSLGTLVLSNMNLELAAGSQTFFEFSDTGLDQIVINGGSASLLGSNMFSLVSGSAPLGPYKWGLGTYDFIIASNITWNAQYDSLTNLVLAGLVYGQDYRYGIVDIDGGLQALRLEFVPEPSTVLLLLGGGLVLYRVRTNRRKPAAGRRGSQSGATTVLGLVLALALVAGSASARVLIEQQDFSLGYGFGAAGCKTNETAAFNTPTTAPNPDGSSFTMGDFKFTITTANTLPFGSQGATAFTNRVLTSNSPDVSTVCNNQNGFLVTINGIYTGTYPPGGGLKDPSFSLAIDRISIYGVKYPDYGTTNEFYWTEETAGHSGLSPSVFLTATGGLQYTQAPYYKQLAWDPADWEFNGTNITRTFRLPTGVDYFPVIDGLEIIGYALVTADVPEPSAVALFAMGGAGLAWWWRRRK